MSFAYAVIGLGLISSSWLDYLTKIPQEKVPVRPWWHSLVMGVGLLAVGYSILIAAGNLLIILILAILSIGLAGLFFYLLTVATLPDGEIAVKVGGPFLPFEAVDGNKRPFSTEQWQGKRVMFKLFRGHW
ncbi:MAG: hypothetical protein AAF490_17510 [Chloroflexota bacterium]